MKSSNNSRAIVAQSLVAVLDHGQSLTRVLGSVNHPESGLIQETTYGVLRWYWQLLAYTDHFLKSPMRKRDTDVLALILAGFYQIEHLNIPVYAVVSETVNSCDVLGKGWAKSLVNAVLRGFVRKRSDLDIKMGEQARFNHPLWMLKQLKSGWPEHWEAIATANNARPPMVLRTNARLGTRDSYLEKLTKVGIAASAEPLADESIIVHKPIPVDQLPGFDRGWVSVQDTAAQWAVNLLQPNSGDRVLDACAAPGGKLAHILERHPDLGELTALEIDGQRVRSIKAGLNRLGLTATVIHADATDTASWWDGLSYQRILVDAPCSGSGVIRRHPDIKHHRQPADMKQWMQKQKQLLRCLWPLLAPAGRLVYATCSILKAENVGQIESFVGELTNVRVVDFSLPVGIACDFGWQTLPGIHPVDGFYYAVLQKTG